MIIGIDEVGRGAWAGPVCVAAVALDPVEFAGLADSKTISKKKRKVLELEIKQKARDIGIGWVSAKKIDEIGMSAALKAAAEQALAGCNIEIDDRIIVDGTIQLVDHPRSSTLKQADALIPGVSAASIIAKEARDRYMRQLERVFPGYHLGVHVGYGTALHTAALQEIGVSPVHRLSFRPMKDMATKSFERPAKVRAKNDMGLIAEKAACEWLTSRGYQVIDRNWKTKLCEIDLIATKGNEVWFVESKYRRSDSHGAGLSYITTAKQSQMRFAARLWMHRTKSPLQPRLAAIASTGDPVVIESFVEVA